LIRSVITSYDGFPAQIFSDRSRSTSSSSDAAPPGSGGIIDVSAGPEDVTGHSFLRIRLGFPTRRRRWPKIRRAEP
jgi:hypothetical protein